MSNIVIISKYTTQQHIVKTRFHYLAYFLYALQLLILLYIIISRRVFFYFKPENNFVVLWLLARIDQSLSVYSVE